MLPTKITMLLIFMALTLPTSAQQAMDYQYFYDAQGQLSKTVDSEGVVIDYVYDELGNILETQRSIISGLAIFDFTPPQGPKGSTVIIQGQGFSNTLLNNTVKFNGAVTTVLSATEHRLEVIVPVSATNGPIEVSVASDSAQSATDFIVPPVITSIAPNLAVSGANITDFQVSGENLTDTSFGFLPSFIPPFVVINTTSINPGGTSASLDISIADNAQGTLVLVATSVAESSERLPSTENSLEILDANGDEDGDGVSNADELALGSNLRNPDSDNDGWPDNIEFEFNGNLTDPAAGPKMYTVAAPPRLIIIRHGLDGAPEFPANTTVANPPELVIIRHGLDAPPEFPANTTVANPPELVIIHHTLENNPDLPTNTTLAKPPVTVQFTQ